MAFISYIENDLASPDLLALYDRFRMPGGQVDNILRIHGHNPPTLSAHAALYQTVVRGRSQLSRIQREMIAIVVSAINECHY